MKRLFVFCMMAIVAVVVQAQTTRHERSEFSFKNTKVKNADGEISHVKMGAYVGNQLVKEYTFELPAPVPEDMAELIGTVSEEDLNFDGYPESGLKMNVLIAKYLSGLIDEVEYDEHVWLSLKNADVACKAIAEELAALDQKNAATYRAN